SQRCPARQPALDTRHVGVDRPRFEAMRGDVSECFLWTASTESQHRVRQQNRASATLVAMYEHACWQCMSTPASASSVSPAAAKCAARDHSRGGWLCPKSHIGACTTFAGPKSTRSTARSCASHVWNADRQLTTCVPPPARSRGNVV